MTADLGNGAAIATLLSGDRTTVIGHLYLWESGDLGILWTGYYRDISFIDRELDVDILDRARAVDSAEMVEFLEGLPLKAS